MTHHIRINDIQYYIERRGDGPPLILLHGFTGATANWGPHIPAFARQHITIAVDLLGHGQTDAPPNPGRYRMADAAADILRIADHFGADSFHLLGYSMGGRLALYIACNHPKRIRSLVLESASPGLKTDDERNERRASDEALADRIEREGIAAFVDFWESISLFETQQNVPPESRAHLREQRLKNRPLGLANSLRGMGTGIQPSLWEALPSLNVPTLLITGEFDTKFDRINGAMQAQMPNARREIIAGAGHTTHFERPITFQKVVLRFLHDS